MKRLVIALLVSSPWLAVAQQPATQQKPIKPSISKAESAWKANKLDEAKTIIDATVANDEFMMVTDKKKGTQKPSKNAAKAWYIRGLIYAAIDTTKKEQFKDLDPNPFAELKNSFDKCEEIDGGKTASFISDPNGFPIITDQVRAILAQAYFNKAVYEYQDNSDYKKAFERIEQTLYFLPNDTSILLNAGVFFAPSADEDEKALAYIQQYHALGGRNKDSFIQQFAIYSTKQKNYEAALAVARKAMELYPTDTDFPKYELDMFIKMNRLPEAKVAMEKQANADPSDKLSRYYLGVISQELKQMDEALRWYNEAIKLDPKYFDAQIALADLVYLDARVVKAQMNQLGITKEDMKKKLELDKLYLEKLRAALPYWENCEKLSPDEPRVLDTLLNIYYDLDNQPQAARLEKKMKSLGLLD
jgi:tetratricopeptide (TPR) repeat protein